RLAVLMITSVLDQRYVGDPQTQEVPPVVQLCQGVLTLLCRSRIAGVDVGYAAGDDQFICMREQETAQAEGFVAECLWIPQGGVTKLFSALGQSTNWVEVSASVNQNTPFRPRSMDCLPREYLLMLRRISGL